MKKLLLSKRYLCVCLTLLLLCGCGGGDVLPVTKQISFTAALEYCGEDYVCSTSVDKNGAMRLEVNEPEALRGLKFTVDGDNITAEMMGLKYTPDTGKMPLGAAALRLYGIFAGCSSVVLSKSAGNCSYEGRLADSEYTVTFSPVGLPLGASLSDGSLSAKFENVTVIRD